MDVPVLMRPTDVARLLNLSTERVYQLIRARELPSVRVGGALRIPRPAWEKWLATKSAEAQPDPEAGHP